MAKNSSSGGNSVPKGLPRNNPGSVIIKGNVPNMKNPPPPPPEKK